ncbi:hypothetical protein F4X73_05865 [Candidatus Poribacteria bacterium]|nr:hypothetical protein [Candidatus Poribacteria bacterium]
MNIINFLNKNDGAIIAIATLVLVCITLWYVIETMRMRRTTQEMLRVSNTPEIQVSLSIERGTFDLQSLDLCIENIGTGFAYDVEFTGTITSFSPRDEDITLGEYDLIKNGVSHFGSGKRYHIPLLWPYREEDLPAEPYTMDVTYKDSTKKEKEGKFLLDFRKVEDFSPPGDPSLDRIAGSLRNIDRTLQRAESVQRSNRWSQ